MQVMQKLVDNDIKGHFTKNMIKGNCFNATHKNKFTESCKQKWFWMFCLHAFNKLLRRYFTETPKREVKAIWNVANRVPKRATYKCRTSY